MFRCLLTCFSLSIFRFKSFFVLFGVKLEHLMCCYLFLRLFVVLERVGGVEWFNLFGGGFHSDVNVVLSFN